MSVFCITFTIFFKGQTTGLKQLKSFGFFASCIPYCAIRWKDLTTISSFLHYNKANMFKNILVCIVNCPTEWSYTDAIKMLSNKLQVMDCVFYENIFWSFQWWKMGHNQKCNSKKRKMSSPPFWRTVFPLYNLPCK